MNFGTYAPDTREYQLLQIVANMLTERATRTTFCVDDTYWDVGAGIVWTTIIANRDDGSSWQVLYPYRRKAILAATEAADLLKVVDSIVNSPYAPEI